MRPTHIALEICGFAGPLIAQNPDPFTAYHQAVGSQLSAMLETEQTIRRELPVVTPLPQDSPTQPRLTGAAEIKAFARQYRGGREPQFTAAFDRLQRLRPTLEPILEAEGVPKELAAVVLVESGAQALALSPRQARGLWQFMPKTARRYGLTVSADKDERVQLELATRAAARYLRDLNERFGNWPLALAAYNAGENAVQAALEKTRASTFSELSTAGMLPAETRSYVPAVLAAMGLLGTKRPDVPNPEKTSPEVWVYASAGVTN